MNSRISIQRRLMIPVILLGAVALLASVLSVFSINNVNANASKIADEQMTAATQLEKIRCGILNIRKMALSHIVAADYETMITIAAQIKEEEAKLDKS